MGRTLRLRGAAVPQEPAHPPSALPERHSGPSPCQVPGPAPQLSPPPSPGTAAFPAGGSDPSQPHLPTPGLGPPAQSIPLPDTRPPAVRTRSILQVRERSCPGYLPGAISPRIKGLQNGRGRCGRRTCTSTGCLCSAWSQPLTLTLPGAHVPSFLSSACLGHSTTL